MAVWHVSAGPSACLVLSLEAIAWPSMRVGRTAEGIRAGPPAAEPQTIDHSTGEAVSYFHVVLLEKIGTLTPSRQARGDQGRARWSIRVGKSCSVQRCAGVLQGMQGFAGGVPTTAGTASPNWRHSGCCQEPEGFSGG